MTRRLAVRAALVAFALLAALAFSGALRDTAPPELYVEVERRVAAQDPFDLFLSASEPVTYRLDYGGMEIERVAQDLTISLLAVEGANDLVVRAVDAAGNETAWSRSIVGVAATVPVLEAPSEARAGDPVTIVARWSGDARTVDADLTSPATAVRTIAGEGMLRAVAAVPLGATDADWPLEARLVDEFGRVTRTHASLSIKAGDHPVQELNVPSTTLSVITPNGREQERDAFERAYAETLPDPLWSEPFLMPIEGRSTSGFGLPRRYAAGGPVSYHEGSDIGAPTGTPIAATNDGVVRIAGFFPIKGGLTIIDHGAGVSSLYFHQSEIAVEAGETVSRGQVIGKVGSTGLSTGPHLHWEMRVEEVPTNPMSWVGAVWP